MTNSLSNRKRIHFIAIFVVVLGFLNGILESSFRELWFDEALTIGDFMYLPTVAAIYHNYVIPNNHIVYTIFLKFWNDLYPSGISLDFYWRLFTVLTAAITIWVIFERWRKRYGTITLALVLFAFTYSLPFEIYATAVRGYMLSMLWIVLCLEFARAWVRKPNWRIGTGYFMFCLLAVGTIPSNLLALAGIVIFLFPYFGFKKVLKWKFIYLATVPLAATAIFYLPISRQVAGILKLHEGWNSGFAVAKVVYSSFMIAFLPLIIVAAAGGIIYLHRRKNRKFLWSLLIFIIPLVIVFLHSPAPFPRVFVTLWPLWMLLLCVGIRHFMASRVIRNQRLVTAGVLLTASIVWGMFCHNYRAPLAKVFHNEQHLDDFFNPYYMTPEYKPWELVQKIKKFTDGNEISVYLSFNAEPYVIMLYGRMAGISPTRWIFDKPHPRGKVSNLTPGTWILIKTIELKRGELESIKKRFEIKLVKPLFQNGVYSVFQIIN